MDHEPINNPKPQSRETGSAQPCGLFAREHEAHAAQIIETGLRAAEQAGASIDGSTARIIAATLHTGHGTALERFAATGALDVDLALAELDHGLVVQHQVSWVSALWDFLERRTYMAPDELVNTRRYGMARRVA